MIEAMHSIGLTDGMITSLAITIILCGLSIFAGRRLQTVPSGFQNFAEWAVGSLYNFFEGIMGAKACRQYFPLIATLFIYILFCNYAGLLPASGHIPGLAAPTGSINCPMAMAVIVFVTMFAAGIREHHGLGYFKHYFKPFAFLFPLMVLEDLVKPVSLTLRLYGNIYGEELAAETLFELFPVGLPIVMHILSLLFCFIQAMVFTMLLAVFIHEATEDEE